MVHHSSMPAPLARRLPPTTNFRVEQAQASKCTVSTSTPAVLHKRTARTSSSSEGRSPAISDTATGVGKALLAFAPPEILEQVRSRQLRQLTRHSITDQTRLHDELSTIRASRLAYDREEAQLGACCVAAPIVVRGVAVAALSVAVATQQFHPGRLAPAVQATALALARTLDRSG